MHVTIEVPLPPRGKGRPRMAVVAGRPRVYTPHETRRWESDLAVLASQKMPPGILEGPLLVGIAAIVQRPKRLMRKMDPEGLLWRPSRPDGDNVRKSVLDALNSFWRDDAQVVCGETLSLYAEKNGRGRVVIAITTMVPEPHQAYERLLGGPI